MFPYPLRQLSIRLAVAPRLGPGVIVPLETALAAVLGLILIGDQSVWLSEGFSIAFAKLSWSEMWQIVREREANQGLYYLMLRPWLAFGEGEAAVRSLSVIFAVATIPAIYALGSRLFDSRVGLAAGLLMAVNGFFIQYAQEARSYSLLLLLVTLSSYLFVTALEAPSWRRWALYALVSALAVYAHFFAALVLLAQAESLLFLGFARAPWRRYSAAGVAAAVLITPLALFIAFRDTGQLDWVAKPALRDPADILTRLAGGRVPALAYFVACAAASVAAVKIWVRFRTSVEAWRYAFLLVWLLLPLVLAFGVSQVDPIFVTRFFMICLPPLVLLAAAGVCLVVSRLAFAASLTVLVLFSVYGVATWYDFEKDNWRAATAYVLDGSQPGDGVVFFSQVMNVPFDYYRNRLEAADEDLTYIDYASGDVVPRGYLDGTDDSGVSTLLGAGLAQRFDRVWLVVSHKSAAGLGDLATKGRQIEAELQEGYSPVDEQRFAGIRVVLFERR